jgi:SWI/SNF-related matrix-associated actin-dependent regulator of chromatin subfamily A protein 2/4
MGNTGQMMQMTQSSGPVNKISEQPNPKNAITTSEAMQMQYAARQMQQGNRAATPTATPADTAGPQAPTQGARPHSSFTKHQLHVLKAQILAFRRLKVREH